MTVPSYYPGVQVSDVTASADSTPYQVFFISEDPTSPLRPTSTVPIAAYDTDGVTPMPNSLTADIKERVNLLDSFNEWVVPYLDFLSPTIALGVPA